MDSTQREIARKLMDVLMRYRSFCRKRRPDQAMRHSELQTMFRLKELTASAEQGVTISEISRNLRVTSPTVTQLINSLEEGGLVSRSIDPADRRSIRVTLTEQGRAVVKQASERFFSLHSGLVEHLGKEKSLMLIGLLSECIDYFNNVSANNFAGEGK